LEGAGSDFIATPMLVQIQFNSPKPVYLQIVDQVKAAAASGALRPGEALPSIRPLAEELRVNRNTVAKAYSELEAEGIIESRPGKGCFVSENHSPFKKELCRKMIGEQIDELVVQAHHYQIAREELLHLVDQRLQRWEERKRQAQQKTEP
jgi:GntR family transcriptional regulator